ncbi:MAG: GxxExxY protein [Verrucomicrobiota bacterium]|nr:GxxExxY protein [Verrucomicrobiota bacterium]
MMRELLHKEEAYQVIGACFEVYKEKGCGFLEEVYQEALEMELDLQSIPFNAQQGIKLRYKGREMKRRYVPDFLVYGKIIVEIKAVDKLMDKHRAQVINYLHATGLELALLVNFGHYPKLEWERLVLQKK